MGFNGLKARATSRIHFNFLKSQVLSLWGNSYEKFMIPDVKLHFTHDESNIY